MDIQLVKDALCIRDPRHPLNYAIFTDEEQLVPMQNCSCDNCFYGRSPIADAYLRLHAFTNDIMEPWPMGDVDGGYLQDKAVEYDLLQEVELHAPCSTEEGDCQCLESITTKEMESGFKCYRKTTLLTGNAKSNQNIQELIQLSDSTSQSETSK